MRYYIEEDEEYFYDIQDVIDHCVSEDYYSDDDDYFEEWVNDTYYDQKVTIAGYEFRPYDIAREMSYHDAFDDLLREYKESMTDRDADDGYYNLEHAAAGAKVYIQGYTIIVEEDEEEEEVDEPVGLYGDEPLDKTGDTDGDDLLWLREKLEANRAAEELKCAAEAKEEDDLMKMFQVI